MIRHRMRRAAIALLLAGLGATTGAQAQNAFLIDGGTFANMMMQPNIDRMLQRNMALARGDWRGQDTQGTRSADLGRAAAGASTPRHSTVIKPAGPSRVPAMLAQAYPEAARPQAERSFRQLLSGYHEIERRYGVPRHDVAGAVATLLVGSWMAYHASDFPDEHFGPLVRQMRGLLARNPDFAAADAQQKQEMYEQLALLGMLTATTQLALKQNPGAPDAERAQARLTQAGKAYLEQFLQTDASRVQLTERGLELR